MNTPYNSSSNPELTAWHCKQAALLYHFASVERLKGLQRMVSALIDGVVEPLLLLAQAEQRDSVLVDARWGNRNTSANWSNNAWPFLKEFQASLVKDIAGRAFERYGTTGVNEYFRGIGEYSTQWMTPAEQTNLEAAISLISAYAIDVDDTLNDYHDSRWTDSCFTKVFKEFASTHTQIPKFRIRTDVTGESGKTPARTGVYVPQDDPHAAMQFAWIGNGGGKLRPSKTFSGIGLAALEKVGRDALWLDEEKMFAFAMQPQYQALFKPTILMGGEEHRDFSSIAVAKAAFIDRPCKWYFVEIANDEYVDIANSPIMGEALSGVQRISGGEICRVAGYYFTPARPNSRRQLQQGQAAPEYESQYGKTIWQWDASQD
jgi:hypothetical protein